MSVMSGALGQKGGWRNQRFFNFLSAKKGEPDT